MSRVPRHSLDDRLTRALAPLADSAPMPPRLLDVPDASVRGGRGTWAADHPVLAVAGVAAAAVVVVLLGLLGPLLQAPRVGDEGRDVSLPMERLDLAPLTIANPAIAGVPAEAATGDVVQVARGRAALLAFRLVAYRSAEGNCLWFEWAGQSSSGCASLPEQDPMGDGVIGMTLYELNPATDGYIYGLVAPDARRLEVRARDGSRAEARLLDLAPAGIAAQAYLVFLPVGFEAARIDVGAADGTRLTELDLEPWLRGVPPARARPLVPEPSVMVVLRNHTDGRPIFRMTFGEGGDAGEALSPTDACDVNVMEVPLREGLDWSVEVDGEVVVDSTTPLPAAEPDTVIEIIVELRPDERPTVSATSVRQIEDSTLGPGAGRSELPGRSERWWELGQGLDCEWVPGP
jgi:hypothetical protein